MLYISFAGNKKRRAEAAVQEMIGLALEKKKIDRDSKVYGVLDCQLNQKTALGYSIIIRMAGEKNRMTSRFALSVPTLHPGCEDKLTGSYPR